MTELIDSHAHLQEPEFAADVDAAIERARQAGVAGIVVPGVDLETSRAALGLARRRQGLMAAAGFHPHEAARFSDEALGGIEVLLAEPEAVAVGEIGLDYYRMHSPRREQLAAFAAQLALAERLALPVIVHCRDAWDDLDAVLAPWARSAHQVYGGRPLGVLHYFSADFATAARYVESGFFISVHTSVTHPKAAQLREVAASLPLEALLIETDSPYGAPQSQRGRRNEPAYVVEAAKKVAELKSLSPEVVAAATTANAVRLFGAKAAAAGAPAAQGLSR